MADAPVADPGLFLGRDPVDGNPFDDDDVRHQPWAEATLVAGAALHRFHATVLKAGRSVAGLGVPGYHAYLEDLAVGQFDVWAKRHLRVVWGDEALQQYVDHLRHLADEQVLSVRNCALELARCADADFGIEGLIVEVRARLLERLESWRGEAHAYLLEQQAGRSTLPDPTGTQGQDANVTLTPSRTIPNTFRRTPDGWEVAFGGQRTTGLKDLKGMAIIHTLLMHPGVLTPANMLIEVAPTPDAARAAATKNESSLHVGDTPSASPDERKSRRATERAMQDGVEELKKERELYKASGNHERVAKIEDQILALVRFGGVSGLPASPIDRARQAASKNFRTALKRIDQALPELARHLGKSIRPGTSFVYQPPERIEWRT